MAFSFKKRRKESHIYIGAAAGTVALIILGIIFIGGDSDPAQAYNKDLDSIQAVQDVADEDLFFSYAADRETEIQAARIDNVKIRALAEQAVEEASVSKNQTDKDDKKSESLTFFVDRDVVTINKGDTLAGLLGDSGIDRGRAYNAVEAMKEVFDPRNLRVGQDITLLYDNKNSTRHFTGLQFNPDRIRSIVVMEKFNGDFTAQEIAKELDERVVALGGTISTSLSEAGDEAGVPYSVLGRLISVYSWDIDFQRDIREGDTFEIMYESFVDEDGEQLKTGDILYANLNLSGRPIEIFRFEMKDGTIDWFKRDGVSVKRALMKTPINGARLSSGFGRRHHPVLGYTKMHKGVDFAAPTGTPIFASGNGVIEEAGRKGSFGNYVRIRHRQGLSTAYAHMSRIGKGITKGKRVQQKDVIGYVGTTGRSTGPHLHYEVHVNGKAVNPRGVNLPLGIQLTGTDKANFEVIMNKTDKNLIAARSDGAKLAAIIKKKHDAKAASDSQ